MKEEIKKIQETIKKLNNQLDDLKELNRQKMKFNIRQSLDSTNAWQNDDIIGRLQNKAGRLDAILLIK